MNVITLNKNLKKMMNNIVAIRYIYGGFLNASGIYPEPGFEGAFLIVLTKK